MRQATAAIFIMCGTLSLTVGCIRREEPVGSSSAASSSTKLGVSTNSNPAESAAPREMVQIPAGKFLMGDEDEFDAPPHEVFVSSFYLGKYPVTQQDFERVMGSNPSRWKGLSNPVEQVRWSDAVKYCNQRSELEGLQPCYDLSTWKCDFTANGYRLPTEAEWEYACRAGTTTAYFFGNNDQQLRDFAWYSKNSGGRPRPVRQHGANPWGLYDMCGNVWEWCNDFYQVDYYEHAPSQDPRGPDTGDKKVVRGGAWSFDSENCRSGFRYYENPGYVDACFGYDIYGFRCARNASE